MGLSNGLIVSNAQFKASSVLDSFHGPERARLYSHRDGGYTGGWTPRSEFTNQIQSYNCFVRTSLKRFFFLHFYILGFVWSLCVCKIAIEINIKMPAWWIKIYGKLNNKMVTVIKYHEQFFLTVWTITASGSKLTFFPQKRFMGSSHKVAPTFLTGSRSTRSTTVRTENHSYRWPLVQRTRRPKRSTVTLTTITRSPMFSTRKSRQGSLGMEMFDLLSVVNYKK